MPRVAGWSLPLWVRESRMAVWMSTPDREIGFFNDRAEALLGASAAQCMGRPCFEVVGARRSGGRPFCGPRCPFFRMAERRRALEPKTLVIDRGHRNPLWIQLLVIPIRYRKAVSLLHCAWGAGRAQRAEEYLVRLASRSRARLHPDALCSLSLRELEVLEHLAADQELPDIARRLFLSHATVRNHVQHILAKLGAHSVQEAVALYLLGHEA